MKIVLAEQLGNGSSGPERSFDQNVVRIGRDPGDCDIAFESSAYPMVSRRHAELQSAAGKWFITDLNSSYGTYLNGVRVSGTQPIGVGSSLQFGESGPILRVVWFEVPAEPVQTSTPVESAIKDPFAARAPGQAVKATPPPPRPAAAPARLEFVGGNPRTPVNLAGHDNWLGRDTACEITFEAAVVMVSRKHAQITFRNGNYLIEDNNSFNGTLVNEQRISAPTPLYDGDEIRLGIGGPVLRFASPARVAPKGASLPGQRSIAIGQLGASFAAQAAPSKTMVFQLEKPNDLSGARDLAEPQLLMSLSFGDKKELTIGRDDRNDIKLDGLQISNRHGRLIRSGSSIIIEDLNSTNGVYINGNRAARKAVGPEDRIQIGSFLIRVDAASNVGVFDTRSKTRMDAVGLTKDVRDRFGGGKVRVLDGISLSVRPNEFVGLLGPSGAGKSMLMDAMNGMRPANPETFSSTISICTGISISSSNRSVTFRRTTSSTAS